MKRQYHFIRKRLRGIGSRAAATLADTRGDLATNTIGGIIIAVVVIGLLIMAINSFFPGFFSDMFEKMEQRLNANW